jgi:hypothetical protein
MPEVGRTGLGDLATRVTVLETQQPELVRRIADIEKTQPEVMADKLSDLADEVRSLKRSFYAFGFTVIGGAIVFAFGVFELLGR